MDSWRWGRYNMLDDVAKGRGVDYRIEQLLAKARGES